MSSIRRPVFKTRMAFLHFGNLVKGDGSKVFMVRWEAGAMLAGDDWEPMNEEAEQLLRDHRAGKVESRRVNYEIVSMSDHMGTVPSVIASHEYKDLKRRAVKHFEQEEKRAAMELSEKPPTRGRGRKEEAPMRKEPRKPVLQKEDVFKTEEDEGDPEDTFLNAVQERIADKSPL